MNEKENIINRIICSMLPSLSSDQIDELRRQLHAHLCQYDITPQKTALIPWDGSAYAVIDQFCSAKLATGKSRRTIEQYRLAARAMVDYICKPVQQITDDDITRFFIHHRATHNVGETTMHNIRAYLSSFFGWCRRARIINENPMDLVEAIRPDVRVQRPFADEDVVQMRDACEAARGRTRLRNKAILDMLNSSMVRVSELIGLDRTDIDLGRRECIVYGKGNKERVVYFDAATKIHLQEYLASRTDSCPALFIGSKAPARRLTAEAIRSILAGIGQQGHVAKVHPHRFRRTGATRCLRHGVPIDAVSKMMGHAEIATTQLYAQQSTDALKYQFSTVYA